ncbi:hypothetical protein [Beijerinckia sp. L45]|uniref:hypothetical protein n=1 Tax=Beijerinckia sp. L45 TaxID=1641855 RepID=UPI00131BEA5B|nr:hypothetical protein [Beijerinckia sp. L45]
MGVVAGARHVYRRCKDWLTRYLANDDPYAAIANTAAFIVWSNQPTYPLYVAFLVGRDAWPSLLTWLSTPFFVAVPLLARRSPLAGRSLLVIAGLANSLLSLKAFGPESGIAWFFVPCLVIAVLFFRLREWPTIIVLATFTGLCALTAGHLGAPLHEFTPAEYTSLTHLNLYSVAALTPYLVIAAIRVRLSSARHAERA